MCGVTTFSHEASLTDDERLWRYSNFSAADKILRSKISATRLQKFLVTVVTN